MDTFLIVNNNDGTYHIECLFVVYRQKFGHHPDFLPQDEARGKREGFSTKFWFMIEDNLSAAEASEKLSYYKTTYEQLIAEIENNDARWNDFPFKDKPVVYSK